MDDILCRIGFVGHSDCGNICNSAGWQTVGRRARQQLSRVRQGAVRRLRRNEKSQRRFGQSVGFLRQANASGNAYKSGGMRQRRQPKFCRFAGRAVRAACRMQQIRQSNAGLCNLSYRQTCKRKISNRRRPCRTFSLVRRFK